MFIDPTLGIFLPFIWLLVWLLSRDSHNSYASSNDDRYWQPKDKFSHKCGTNIIKDCYRNSKGQYCITISNAYVDDGLCFIEADTKEEAQKLVDEKFEEWTKEWVAK